MKPSATDISLKYLKGLSEEIRKKNSSKFGKNAHVEETPHAEGEESDEMGEDEISSLMEGLPEGEESGEHEMGMGMGDEESDVKKSHIMRDEDMPHGLFGKKNKVPTKY